MNIEQTKYGTHQRHTDPDILANLRRENLRKWMRERSLSNSDLALKIDSGRAYVSNLFSEDRYFGEKAARRIESMLRMPAGYLDAKGMPPLVVADWSAPGELDPDTFALVPHVRVVLSGGVLTDEPEDQLPPLAFRREWLLSRGVTSRGNLRICTVPDISMEPYLNSGDAVLVDTGQAAIKEGEVYAIRYCDEIRVKRLFRTLDGVRIHSDNPEFPHEIVSPASTNFEIIGRKIWRGG